MNLSSSTVTDASNQSMNRLTYDKKCDVYSFAIVMYVIYFRTKNPYGANVTDNQILFKLSTEPDFRPKINESKIPPNERWLTEIMRQCWSSDPNQRPSFEQICEMLRKPVIKPRSKPTSPQVAEPKTKKQPPPIKPRVKSIATTSNEQPKENIQQKKVPPPITPRVKSISRE